LKTLEVVGVWSRRDREPRSFGECWDLLHAKSAKGGAKSAKGIGELGTWGVGGWGMYGKI